MCDSHTEQPHGVETVHCLGLRLPVASASTPSVLFAQHRHTDRLAAGLFMRKGGYGCEAAFEGAERSPKDSAYSRPQCSMHEESPERTHLLRAPRIRRGEDSLLGFDQAWDRAAVLRWSSHPRELGPRVAGMLRQ